MGNLLPPLSIPAGETDRTLFWPAFEKEPERILPQDSTAVITFLGSASLMHVYCARTSNRPELELWPKTDKQQEALEQMLETHPRFRFPDFAKYKFWRAGLKATDEQVQENYGFRQESYLTEQGSIIEYSSFNGIIREFGDNKNARHLEVRNPAQTFVQTRVPAEVYHRELNPGRGPSREEEYTALWIPKLSWDKSASVWYQPIEDAAVRELARSIEEAEALARRAETEAHVDELLKDVFKDFKDLGEAA
jgi:hypothetical protein